MYSGYLIRWLYIVTLSLALLQKMPDQNVPYYVRYVNMLLWIFLGLAVLRCRRREDGACSVIRFHTLNMCLPYVASGLLLFIPWLCNGFEVITLRYLTRAVSETLQHVLIFASAAAAFYLFSLKALEYTFYSLCLNNFIIVILCIQKFGIKEFLINGLRPWGPLADVWRPEGTVITNLEIHDVTFAFAFYVIYYWLFCPKERPHRRRDLLLSLFFFYLGYKRIGIAGIFAALLIFLAGKKIKFKSVAASITWIFCGGLFLFVWLIKSDVLQNLIRYFGLNISNRLETYAYLSQYLEFSPAYFGRGLGAAGKINQAARMVNNTLINGHSDILYRYIDWGFCGFLIWIVFNFYYVTQRIFRLYGSGPAMIWLMFTAYSFITYLTDNTLGYYAFQYVYLLIMLTISYESLTGKSKIARRDKE